MSVSSFPYGVIGGTPGCAIDTLTTINLSDTQTFSDDAGVGFNCHSNGTIQTETGYNTGFSFKESWIGLCANHLYECRLTKSTGDDPSNGPALATWHACSTTRQWDWQETGSSQKDFTGTFEIRRTSDDSVLGSVSVTIAVDVEP